MELTARIINIAANEFVPVAAVATFGRHQDSSVFIADQRVSRQHAIIRQQGSDYWFSDLGSFNGSLINGQRVTSNYKLNDGDIITIADLQYRFELPEFSLPTPIQSPEQPSDLTIMDIKQVDAVIFVSDLKGFTQISEKLPPDQLAQVMGGWYKVCNQVLGNHAATIDKFIGDAVLAYWLNPTPLIRGKALAAARTLQMMCFQQQQQHAAILDPTELQIIAGIGIHLGPIAVSPQGGGTQTILGDAVNATFRLEQITREVNRWILLTGDYLADWPDKPIVDSIGEFTVKGRTAPLQVFATE